MYVVTAWLVICVPRTWVCRVNHLEAWNSRELLNIDNFTLISETGRNNISQHMSSSSYCNCPDITGIFALLRDIYTKSNAWNLSWFYICWMSLRDKHHDCNIWTSPSAQGPFIYTIITVRRRTFESSIHCFSSAASLYTYVGWIFDQNLQAQE